MFIIMIWIVYFTKIRWLMLLVLTNLICCIQKCSCALDPDFQISSFRTTLTFQRASEAQQHKERNKLKYQLLVGRVSQPRLCITARFYSPYTRSALMNLNDSIRTVYFIKFIEYIIFIKNLNWSDIKNHVIKFIFVFHITLKIMLTVYFFLEQNDHMDKNA